jgi:hypothetical protein
MRVLSEIDGQALCYPAFALVVRFRKAYKDGVNFLTPLSKLRAPDRASERHGGWCDDRRARQDLG